jgi:hypothetical protein
MELTRAYDYVLNGISERNGASYSLMGLDA